MRCMATRETMSFLTRRTDHIDEASGIIDVVYLHPRNAILLEVPACSNSDQELLRSCHLGLREADSRKMGVHACPNTPGSTRTWTGGRSSRGFLANQEQKTSCGLLASLPFLAPTLIGSGCDTFWERLQVSLDSGRVSKPQYIFLHLEPDHVFSTKWAGQRHGWLAQKPKFLACGRINRPAEVSMWHTTSPIRATQ